MFEGKKVAVLGWGINGMDVCRFLLKQKAEIAVFDAKGKKDLDFSDFEGKKIKTNLGKNYLKNGLLKYDFIFRSPGVYRFLPELVEAEKKGSVVTSATKLFFELCPAKIIGVTGTKGKGTTSTLIYEILKQAKKDVHLAGNIGTPMLDLLPLLKIKSWVVLELSSFQLIDMTKSPHVSVVLNITSDHMDWHKDRKEYTESKSQIVKYQSGRDFSVLAYDYKDTKSFKKITKSRVFYFSNSQEVNRGCYAVNGKIVLKINAKNYHLGRTNKLLLRGKHNQENVCAAAVASFLTGAKIPAIKEAVFSFKGLEHRLELVGSYKGISFYDDSFSTNPQTTIAAIQSFEEPVTLIIGGSDKGLDYDEMSSEISRRDNIENILIIGEISAVIEKSLKQSKYKGQIISLGKPTMKEIVNKSLSVSTQNGVVLLSPATASFDMFKDYKDRGNQFKNSVMDLT